MEVGLGVVGQHGQHNQRHTRKLLRCSSSISRAVFGHELTAPAGKDGLSFTVDGVWIEAVATGPRAIRLKCTILSELPDREGELRRLMAQYLRYTDRKRCAVHRQ